MKVLNQYPFLKEAMVQASADAVMARAKAAELDVSLSLCMTVLTSKEAMYVVTVPM